MAVVLHLTHSALVRNNLNAASISFTKITSEGNSAVYIGAIAGNSQTVAIANCVSLTVIDSKLSGKGRKIGPIVGSIHDGTITQCYWNEKTPNTKFPTVHQC